MEEVVKYYKDNLTSYSLVYKHMKLTYYFSLFIFGVFLILAYLFIITFPLLLIGNYLAKGICIAFVTIFLFSILTTSYMSKKAKVVILNHYDIHVKKGGWRTIEFDSMQTRMFINYLKLNNLYSKEKLQLIVSFTEKNIERGKTPSFLTPGIFIGLFIPLWSQCVVFIFKGVKETDYNGLFWLTIILVAIIIYFSLIVGTYKSFFHLSKELFLFEDGLKKNFLLKIEDLLLRISDSEIKEDEPYNLILRRKDKAQS
ncbi:hypothetical protein SAMN04487896_3943 [Paenibacillus sp. ov031]|nr:MULTISPECIES: hypothetical protein [unclassified Paenibacillus]MCW3791646.1 hypothetical protein [Paenibacillus sp. LS1]SHN77689.1 hypothetical protein SAMN04487896_3943 [Paenibacillus sp. ov031]